MRARVGTSGYSYPAWKGIFYPEDLPNDEMLAFYSTKLETVEINNTFYRMPTPKVVDSWVSRVPPHFRFVAKVTTSVTGGKEASSRASAMEAFYQRAVPSFGERLGALFFQLPPYLRKTNLPRLQELLSIAPRDVPLAVDLPTSAWWEDAVYDALRARGAAMCIVDRDDRPAGASTTPLVRTADWGYIRLRRADYDDEALRGWARRIREVGWREVYVFFKHEDGALGPRWAMRLAEMFAEGK